MVAIKNLIFIAISVTAAVLPRDATSVLTGLKKIDADTRYLGAANQAYNGSAASAGPIVVGVTSLQTDLNATVKLAQASEKFSEWGAQSIINYFEKPLEPDTVFTLDTLKANKEKIRQGGFYSTVQQQLASLNAAVDQLVSAIEAKTPSNKLPLAKKVLSKYEEEYADAVAYFS